ncbi:hypothetical protein HMPREF1528_02206 [Capnocytophaga sp. oral taxon 336 str. F0502]|nr:hypothetical protein HMPREF1528_02206 [Capnocytophaga sp. oral taxon 336 str. F0502]
MSTNNENPINVASWDKIFPKSDKVEHKKVSFKNRYGITLIGDLYFPKNSEDKKLAALAVCGGFGAVKEQASGFYAQTMAERGFVTLAFDPFLYGRKWWRTSQCSITRYQHRRLFGSGRLLRNSTLCR